MMFLFLMQKGKFRLFNVDLAQLKSSSLLVPMVSFVTFQSVHFFKGIGETLWKRLEICAGV